jgi:hypothetical protein
VIWHPNRTPFEGVLTLVDVASDKAPSGAKNHRKRCPGRKLDERCLCGAEGHRVILTRAAAEAALPSLLGMAVDYRAGWCGHDVRQKCGVIEAAELVGAALHVGGYLFGRDFPEVVKTARRRGTWWNALGMSYELADAHVTDMRQEIWTLTRVTFTGAAILLCRKAAYRRTSFRLVERELALAATGTELRMIEDEVEEDAEEAYCAGA